MKAVHMKPFFTSVFTAQIWMFCYFHLCAKKHSWFLLFSNTCQNVENPRACTGEFQQVVSFLVQFQGSDTFTNATILDELSKMLVEPL